MRYLLFQCYAPLVSWGAIAVSGERLTYRYPKKSSIIGIIASALGIKREDEEKNKQLAQSIGFSTKVISSGTVINDFHTIQIPQVKKNETFNTRKDELESDKTHLKTILSNREYLCDALSLICIWLKDETFDLYKIKYSLHYPTYSPFLGRKACTPAFPLNPRIFKRETIREAFDLYKVIIPSSFDETDDQIKERMRHFHNQVLRDEIISYYWEECDHSGFCPTQKTISYDVPVSRKRWQFTHREEFSYFEKAKENDLYVYE